MIEKSGFYKEYLEKFFIDEPKLRKIVDIFKRFALKLSPDAVIELYVQKKDGSFYYTFDLDDILADDNSFAHEIWRVKILMYLPPKTTVANDSPVAFIDFSKEDHYSIRYYLTENDREWSMLFADELDEQIQRLKADDFDRDIFVKYGDAVLLIACIVIPAYLWIKTMQNGSVNQSPIRLSEDLSYAEALIEANRIITIQMFEYLVPSVGLIASVFATAFFIGVKKPIHAKFAKTWSSWFYWGDMIAVYENKMDKLKFLSRGVIFATIVGIVSTILYDIIW